MDYNDNQVSPDDARQAARKATYRDTLKSLDTEEHIDLAFYRPIGYMWAKLAARLGVTPNAITIASIFLGLGAAITFVSPLLWVNIIGMLLLIWANSFDSADGQLARITRQYSQLGRILDGLAGTLWFLAIYIAICIREVNTEYFFHTHHWVIWVMALASGICHSKQASVADYYRQFHLFFLKGEDGSELDSTRHLREKYERMSWKGSSVLKLILRLYISYTSSQEKMTPAMQRLRRALRQRYHTTTNIPQSFRDEFRRNSLPLMKYTNILTFNWRTITLFITLFIGQPWLYFVVELTVFNAILVYMMIRHERICNRLALQLEQTS